MPEPEGAGTDTNDSGTGAGDQPANVIPPTLDQIHSAEQARLEEEDADAAANSDDNSSESGTDGAGAGDAETDTGDSGGTDDGSAGTDEGAAGGADDAADAASGTDGAAGDGTDDKTTTPPEPTAPLVDTDISKPGEGKVAIKDVEGKTFYFNNLGEVPNDFEPETYKALMVGVDELRDKAETDKANQAKADEAAAQGAARERAASLEKSWEAEASDLTSTGLLPKDEAKNLAAREEVFDYMEAEMKKGNVISSFKQAFKAMSFDKEQTAKIEAQKKENQAKKNRGGLVQPGSGGSGAAPATGRGGKIIQAPPSGATLDQVHNHVTSDM